MCSIRIETTTSLVKHHNKTQIATNISEDTQKMLKSRNSLHKALKEAYSNILKVSPPKTNKFQIKILTFFIFLLKT